MTPARAVAAKSTKNAAAKANKLHFIADLHIHSRYSMATSKELSIAHLDAWATSKGIGVLGTGDFTHPLWRQELEEQLIRDENTGLYKARKSGNNIQFCLQTEISCIYKKYGKTRKVHNLVFMPDLDAVDKFNERLSRIGRLASDGRPILGIDSHDLLDMALSASSEAVLIPAHAWTPWFSLFGAKSGFDSIEECFSDLSPHIFALETGLSSDPPMNRLLSTLDSIALISNSDAHSGANLGREANLFSGNPSYTGIFGALRTAAKRSAEHGECSFLGTLEFYPQEGKYHYDGHRACGISLSPAESIALDNICPVCGKPLTMGVMHRILQLADRETPPALVNEPESRMLVPLREVISEIMGIGIASRKIQRKYESIIQELGPELDILCHLPISRISDYWEQLGEAVKRMRSGKVHIIEGFDGRYGKISLFEPGEITGK